jgi:hypothetical protein
LGRVGGLVDGAVRARVGVLSTDRGGIADNSFALSHIRVSGTGAGGGGIFGCIEVSRVGSHASSSAEPACLGIGCSSKGLVSPPVEVRTNAYLAGTALRLHRCRECTRGIARS